jgi:O-antigen/teichoic acid export membrane protein
MESPLGLGRVAYQRLTSGASWTLAASVSTALSQWLLLMVTAKLGSTEMVGQLALSFAIVAPIQALTDLALRPALATDARRDFHFRDYLELRAKMITIAVAAVGVAGLWKGGISGAIIVAVGLQKAVESMSDLFFGLFQREEKLRWMGESVVMRSALASAAFVGVMLAYRDLLSACFAGLLVRGGIFLFYDLARGAELVDFRGRGSSESRIAGLLKTSLPLASGVFIMSFAVNVPRYVVEKRMGVAALGVFAALVYVFQAGAMLIDAVSQAACARLAHYNVQGEQGAFRALLAKLTLVALGAAGIGVGIAWVGGGTLLRIAYSPAFATAAKPFLWLSVCAVPWYCSSVFGYALIARRQMSQFFYCQLTALAATLGGSYWLIGSGPGVDGLTGACLVVFLTYSVMLALYCIVLWRGGSVEGTQ